MPVRLSGSTSGYTELSAPAVAGNNTLALPTGNGSNGQFLQGNGTGALSWSGSLTLGTAKSSTSGTSIDFSPADGTGIPSWAKRVTVMFNGVSTSGTSLIIVQLGTSAGFVTTGYYGTLTSFNTGGTNGFAFSNVTGIYLRDTNAAANTWQAVLTFSTMGSNIWLCSGNAETAPASGVGTSSIICNRALSGTLDRVRITTVNGTDTFDAGSINIMYEG